MSASVYWFKGSRFILREPENKTGSWAQRQYKQLLKLIIKMSSWVLPAGWESVTNVILNGRWTWHRGCFQLGYGWMSLLSQHLYKTLPRCSRHPRILEMSFIPGEWQWSWLWGHGDPAGQCPVHQLGWLLLQLPPVAAAPLQGWISQLLFCQLCQSVKCNGRTLVLMWIVFSQLDKHVM